MIKRHELITQLRTALRFAESPKENVIEFEIGETEFCFNYDGAEDFIIEYMNAYKKYNGYDCVLVNNGNGKYELKPNHYSESYTKKQIILMTENLRLEVEKRD